MSVYSLPCGWYDGVCGIQIGQFQNIAHHELMGLRECVLRFLSFPCIKIQILRNVGFMFEFVFYNDVMRRSVPRGAFACIGSIWQAHTEEGAGPYVAFVRIKHRYMFFKKAEL